MNVPIKLFAIALVLTGCSSTTENLLSPDGNIEIAFTLTDKGEPSYSAKYKGNDIVLPSLLGFVLKDTTSLTDNFKITGIERSDFNESWTPVWGENDSIENCYTQMIVNLQQGDRKMDIEFRAYNDGFGFRYIFPEQTAKAFVIADEATQIAMAGDHTAWWIPGDYDTQEYEYTTSRLSEIRAHADDNFMDNASQQRFSPTGVQTALMLKTNDGLYLNLHEAALVDFPAMSLELNDTTMTFKSHLTPGQGGTIATIHTPFKTPWRTVTVGEKATDILASNLILNLNDPCVLDDVSWIHPTKYMGVWWEMITGKSSWSYTWADNFDLATFDYSKAKPNGIHGANNENVRRYIDFAAEHGFDQLLVEGWNIGWEDWFGKEKDYVFDFVTPYPDFDIAALNDYAHSKGIKLMMHHETSSSVDNYDRHMDAAYNLMNHYGYDAVKSGYVGNIIPKGEHHYSQKQVKHYLDAVKKAADKHIMVNAHEAVRPTGLCRTYPNLIGNESAMGQEFADMSPQHCTILPFTRLKGGPMDFTPGIFRMKITDFAPGGQGRQKRATIPNQLALYLTMYSPLQMAADMPGHYQKHMDAFQFIKDVPVDWSKSVYLDAEPGEFIVVARKDKGSDAWYVGGVTDENVRDYTLDYNFLPLGKTYEATIYADAPDGDGFDNPEVYTITTKTVDSTSKDKIHMARGGGFAISIKPVE
ncbi:MULTISPECIES: glycoside hydrolase family 97 protein [Bacteroidales]|nr:MULTISPECIES: glycoside hydrolase family 97 protein [Bacteroidales]ROS97201.1 glycoside hydrolase family 97 protein [Muribaculaceae bacterium Isolate-083 (Janvier)]ROS98939.1 glycoside hydrolase family 97 protein [Muribaculaceae bacterium Isolate-077 (Janvier)]ROT01714.1 glycoside hydrolase family 97 protein [Muribaculaceae bacterium Isolate-084 (Janvier)]